MVCTCTVLLHILSGSVWVCNLWSARLWECKAHDWLKGCVVGLNRFHRHPWCRTRIHLQPLACTWAFHLSLPYPRHPHLTVHAADQLNLAKIHKMKSVALWLIQPLPLVMSPTWPTTSTTQRHTAIFQNDSVDIDTEPSYSFGAELDDETIGKSATFTTVHSGARRTSEPETSLSLSWRKVVVSSVFVCLSCKRGDPQ